MHGHSITIDFHVHVLDIYIQWSLSTRDNLASVRYNLYTVEPLYKGQVGDGSFVSRASLRTGPLSLVERFPLPNFI